MDKVAVVGFLNHAVCFPNFVVTIVGAPGKYRAKAPFPGIALSGILSVANEEGLLRCPKFWKDTNNTTLDISRDEFAFAFSQGQVVIGTMEELICEIQKQQIKKTLPQDTLNELNLIIEKLKKNPVSSCYVA